MFAYCGNSPNVFKDVNGEFFDIIWDVASLIFSIADVISDPTDGWAWAGLAGDVVDLIPGVTFAGESIKAAGVGNKVADAVDTARDITKANDNLYDAVKAAKNSTETIQTTYRSFTRYNLRENLKRLTGSDGIGKQAHHVLPVKFEDWFNSRGIKSIHDPKFGSWVDTKAHSSWSNKYNKSWEAFKENNPYASENEIYDFARKLSSEYDFTLNF